MDWQDSFELELEPMDTTHHEFVAYFNRLAAADAASRIEHLDAFIAHTIAHFDQENRWMEAIDFPGCHRAEHDRVIQVLQEVRARAVAGDGFFLGRLIEELPAWFSNHAQGMDAALAFTLKSANFDFATGTLPAGQCGGSALPGACACESPTADGESAERAREKAGAA